MMNILSLYLLVILSLAISFGIFGSFAIWEKNSFFGHTFSHSLLLPLSIALLFGATDNYFILFSTIILAIVFVCIFYYFGKKNTIYYSQDTILVIVSFFCMALAFIINSIQVKKIDVMSYLSGDILLINNLDIAIFYIISAFLILFLLKFNKILILHSISTDLAISTNKNTDLIYVIFLTMQAIFIAIAARAIGVLLISATLLMPSILARLFSKNPMQMIFLSVIVGFVVMFCGAVLSVIINIQFAPIVIVLYCIFLFIACFIK